METRTIDIVGMLAHLTGWGGWSEIQGPDTGVGVDYHYRAGSREAYINIDQDHMTVSVDGENVFAGDVGEEAVRRFIR